MIDVLDRLHARLAGVAKVARVRAEFAGIGDDLAAAVVEINRLRNESARLKRAIWLCPEDHGDDIEVIAYDAPEVGE